MDWYVDFDIDEIKELQDNYILTKEFILTTLPDINWDSRLEVYDYFIKEHNIGLQSLKISELKDILEAYNENDVYFEFAQEIDEAKEVLEGFITYLKTKYEIRNYTQCILRHQVDGRIFLREIDGKLLMPNKQPLVYSQNIIDCITETNVPELVRELDKRKEK